MRSVSLQIVPRHGKNNKIVNCLQKQQQRNEIVCFKTAERLQILRCGSHAHPSVYVGVLFKFSNSTRQFAIQR